MTIPPQFRSMIRQLEALDAMPRSVLSDELRAHGVAAVQLVISGLAARSSEVAALATADPERAA